MVIRVGSICTGYGGLEMAVETVFGPTDLRFVSDVDDDVNTLLANYYPNVPNLGDLTKVNWRAVEQVDLLCAGYPCQPFSVAGKQQGFEYEQGRGQTIFDITRYIKVISPKVFILECERFHINRWSSSDELHFRNLDKFKVPK